MGTANRNEISAHEDTCPEALVPCACGKKMKQTEIAGHEEKDCPLKPILCKYCWLQVAIPRCEMEKHLDECNGNVPMSEVRKLIARIDGLEQEVKRQRKRRRRVLSQTSPTPSNGTSA